MGTEITEGCILTEEISKRWLTCKNKKLVHLNSEAIILLVSCVFNIDLNPHQLLLFLDNQQQTKLHIIFLPFLLLRQKRSPRISPILRQLCGSNCLDKLFSSPQDHHQGPVLTVPTRSYQPD